MLLRTLAKPSLWADATLLGMGRELVSDELWEAIEPLLSPERLKPWAAGLACLAERC
jgi:hypothetical protein